MSAQPPLALQPVTFPDDDLPRARVAQNIDQAARLRTAAAHRFLSHVSSLAGTKRVEFGGFARKGARYDYRTRRAYLSKQVLAWGSPRLIGFILAHEVGHATQLQAKRQAMAWEQVGTSGLAAWIAVSYLPHAPAWMDSPIAFFSALTAVVVYLRAIDLWWEIDADRKARQWTGYGGTLKMIFDEFLSVESIHRETWQSRIRARAADWFWPAPGL